MIRWARTIAALALSLVAATSACRAAATNAAPGFRSTGTLVVQANVSGSPLNVGGMIAVYQSGSLYRLDLLTLAFPGTDPTVSALGAALLAPGGATLIYDGASGAISAYSTGNHVYYADAPKTTATAATPPAQGNLAPSDSGPLGTLAAVARQLHDVQRASIQLLGHSTVNGHPTDDLDVLVRRQRPGKPLEDYHAQVSLADDLDGFPVRIAVSSTPPTPQDFGGSFRLDLTAIVRDTPAAAMFAIPAGLTRVNALGDVLQAKH